MTTRLLFRMSVAIFASLLLASCGAPEPAYSPELIAEGETQYQQTCSACHGQDAKGVENLGRTLVASEFVRDNTDAQLLEYVKAGRAVDDPLNTTGIAMPPKGGNPALTDAQIEAIIAYIRSIQE